MEETREQRIERNANRIIADGVKGEGEFADYFISLRNTLSAKATAAYSFAHKGVAPSGDDYDKIQQDVDAKLQENAEKKLKPLLLQAKSGDTKNIGMEEMMSTAGAISNTYSSFSNGNIIGLITAIPGLLTNSVIGEYVGALIKWAFGGKNGPSLSGALAEVKFEHGIEAFAKSMNVDAVELKKELLAEPQADGGVAANNTANASGLTPQQQEQIIREREAHQRNGGSGAVDAKETPVQPMGSPPPEPTTAAAR